MRNPRRVLPHALIYDRVWGYDFGPESNALRVYIGYLRRKLEDAGSPRADPHRARRRLRPAGVMSLRTRIAAVAGVAVAVTVIAAAVAVYFAVRSSLRGEVEDALDRARRTCRPLRRERPRLRQLPIAARAARRGLGFAPPPREEALGGAGGFVQRISPTARSSGRRAQRATCRSSRSRARSPSPAAAATSGT